MIASHFIIDVDAIIYRVHSLPFAFVHIHLEWRIHLENGNSLIFFVYINIRICHEMSDLSHCKSHSITRCPWSLGFSRETVSSFISIHSACYVIYCYLSLFAFHLMCTTIQHILIVHIIWVLQVGPWALDTTKWV